MLRLRYKNVIQKKEKELPLVVETGLKNNAIFEKTQMCSDF
jgi:hypothetical protein